MPLRSLMKVNESLELSPFSHRDIGKSLSLFFIIFFFRYEVLKEAKDINSGIGYPDWRLALCLAFCYTLLFFTLWKGVASSGKVAYVTAIFPYIVLFTLLVRGVTLPGSYNGIMFYITPKWEKLYSPQVITGRLFSGILFEVHL